MQLNIRILEDERFARKVKSLPVASVFLVLSLLAAACGDNTSTTTPPTVAATTAPAATTAAATTAATTPIPATTAALTSATMTSAAATTATGTTAPAETAASSSSPGQAKVSLANTTVQAGATIDVTGEGFPTNSWVTIGVGPGATTRQVASLALTDNTGKFKVPLILSSYGDGSKIEPGANLIQAITQDGKVTASLTFTIVPAPATTTPNS